ncbi:MAG: FtsQ-type POTRA domain-containing protein [Clostridia bacterium]|nr:FtsQ-type POTRA domain-containing protein [Clostridia bacterium]
MKHSNKTKATRRTTAMAVVVLAALTVLIVLTFSRLLVVRSVIVVGNRNLSREEIITQSGVKPGDHLFGPEVSGLKKALEANRYIEYLGYEFDYKGTLTIRISERLGMATVYVLGIYYVTDENGVVLECAGSQYPTGVAGPKVTGIGLDDNSWITVGEKLPVRDETRLEKMCVVLRALEETNMLAMTSQLDVEQDDNLYVMTSEGTKIELGDVTRLETKLLIAREVLSVREADKEMRGAKIDVSNGRNAHFIPASLPTPTPVPTATPIMTPSATPS